MSSKRFSNAELLHKLFNIDADVSKDFIKNIQNIKKLTGGDLISAERKYAHPFKFINHAKLILLTNEFPNLDEEIDAIYFRTSSILSLTLASSSNLYSFSNLVFDTVLISRKYI